MEKTKIKLIDKIINELDNNKIDGLYQLLIEKDYWYGLELLLSIEELDNLKDMILDSDKCIE